MTQWWLPPHQCVKEHHSFEHHSWVPLPKLGAMEECHSFISKGAIWEWHSYFRGEQKNERPSFFTLFFMTYFFFWCPFVADIIFLSAKMPSETLTVFRTFISYLSCMTICLAKITTCNFSSVLMSKLSVKLKRAKKECTLFLKEQGRSATPFYQKERSGSGTLFFDKDWERSGTLKKWERLTHWIKV